VSDVLELEGVHKWYGANLALEDVTLQIPEGELHAIIGPNGAGKSTLFGVIAGEHLTEKGRVVFGGRDVTRMSPPRRVAAGMARAFQVARVFPALTVAQNLEVAVLAASHKGFVFWRSTRSCLDDGQLQAALDRVRLTRLAGRRARQLSQGDRKRLEIAMALALGARLLLLDEPTAGMSPEETDETVELVRSLWRDGGLTVLLTEHDMKVVFGLAQRITVLQQGRVLCTGDPREVARRPDVIEAYLGKDA
jgi:branched-chain amino acid transport system ATP-binding protein